MNYDSYSKLPDPLNQLEFNDYFEKYKSGDENARKIIIWHSMKYVIYHAKKYSNTFYEEEELIAIGVIGLIKSVDTFDISKKIEFVTYSSRCISNEILLYLRRQQCYNKDISLDTTLYIDKNGNEMKMEDTLYDENVDIVTDYENKETYVNIRKIVESLPKRDKEIVILYFGFVDDTPLTQKQIADILNISESYVSKLLKKILIKLRAQLSAIGIMEASLRGI